MNDLFIHLGGDVIIRSKDIITILNRDAQELSSVTNLFLKAEEKRKAKKVISADYIKSIVVTNDEIYYSPVSSLTLNRRAQGRSLTEQSLDKEEDNDL